MPLIEVKLFDFRMDEETSRKLIAGLTDALCEATTEGLREHTWVVVEGHSPKNWGVGGVPWPAEMTPPKRRAKAVLSLGLGYGASRVNARGLSPRAPGLLGVRRQPCDARMLRVHASHQFACA
jgi:4-oxalocrotonate tautomerase